MATPEQTEESNPIVKKMEDTENKLVSEIGEIWVKEYEDMIRSDEWNINGDTFHSNILTNKRRTELIALQNEELDEGKDPEKYSQNYKRRAQLLIKEIESNPEKFDEVEYLPLENLITAWGRRSLRGFPMLRKSIRKETTTQV